MKSVLFWMLRHLVIPAGFIFATGLPQFIWETRNIEPKAIFTQQELKTLEVSRDNYHEYFDSLLINRKELATHNQYSAFLYFHDLKQIKMYEEKYKNTFPGPNRFNAGRTSIGMIDNDFWCVSAEQWKRGNISDKEISKARNYWFHDDEKRAGPPPNWTEARQVLSSWLFHVYLRGLPFAFILFLIWKLRMKKEFEEEFRWIQEKPQMYFGGAPLSFIISVIVWPFILGIDIRNRFNEVLKKADVVARRNSMFTFFSKQEQQLFEIGKKMSRQEFRDHLDAIGITQKHSFLLALTVTLFLLIIPRSVFPAVDTHHEKQTIVTSIDYGIDHNDSVVSYDYLPQAVIPDFLCVPSSETMYFTFYFPYRIGEILSGFLDDIGGVPKVIFNFAKN